MIDRDTEDTSSARARSWKKPPVLKGTLSVCHVPLDKLASP